MNCTMRIIRLRELYYACSTIFLGECAARPGGSSGRPTPTEALLMVRWDGAMWASPPTEAYHGVRRGGSLLPTVVPTDSRALSCPPIGALPRNRLASSATGGASPISPPAGDRKGRPYGGVTRGAGKESPSHGFAVTAPFRQGGRGDGLPHQ